MLSVKNLSISFKSNKLQNTVVHDISFELKQQQILGIVGESGSGKSVTSLAILGLLSKNAKIKGDIIFNDINLKSLSEKEFQQIRGNKISMIFQEPMSSLNSSLTCGYQVMEILLQHKKLANKVAKEQVIELFNKVKLPRAAVIFNQYPHQLSGGQKQRVMIAMAIACKPQILIADEPTTALDVTVQKEIIQLLKELQRETEMSIIFISHDLSLVSEIADNVLVMYQGNIVEQGEVKQVFRAPKHNYTKALINSKPNLKERIKKLPTVQDFMNGTFQKEIYSDLERTQFHKNIYSKKPLLEVKNLATYFISNNSFFFGKKNVVKAVDNVSFQLFEGETLGLVGESGCGKTTLGRTILHLEKAIKGTIFYKQKDITNLSKNELKVFRKEVQIIFQDPFSSLNPRIPVGKAIMEPMKVHTIFSSYEERKKHVLDILNKVGLEEAHFYRYPHEFSGGQRQRIGIARTIALKPKLIICDESVSALDVSVQAQVLNLLNTLKEEFGFTYIFISHDLAVVKYMSDQLVVMNKGKIEEIGDADTIYKTPKTTYTKKLIDAIPKGIDD
ncbi:peptide/nickel transport system ATP-binding protein [Lutibacter oceani]|uniref:Peptide/nickel transport system ATP-binding protein n=1 Tax=Lutibacter oceani TaxID=1853311 RepID=A0A3D9S4T6_9FLAO|nr:ABC transporter ATP-binding protein [Lutibacter oceani]REE83572.1 peptide/nickel transport system ATP-binding protein [Lutibacter oceani]